MLAQYFESELITSFVRYLNYRSWVLEDIHSLYKETNLFGSSDKKITCPKSPLLEKVRSCEQGYM